jgi:hypothetical protein
VSRDQITFFASRKDKPQLNNNGCGTVPRIRIDVPFRFENGWFHFETKVVGLSPQVMEIYRQNDLTPKTHPIEVEIVLQNDMCTEFLCPNYVAVQFVESLLGQLKGIPSLDEVTEAEALELPKVKAASPITSLIEREAPIELLARRSGTYMELYAHAGNSGTTFAVKSDGGSPRLDVSSSFNGLGSSEISTVLSPRHLRELGSALFQAGCRLDMVEHSHSRPENFDNRVIPIREHSRILEISTPNLRLLSDFVKAIGEIVGRYSDYKTSWSYHDVNTILHEKGEAPQSFTNEVIFGGVGGVKIPIEFKLPPVPEKKLKFKPRPDVGPERPKNRNVEYDVSFPTEFNVKLSAEDGLAFYQMVSELRYLCSRNKRVKFPALEIAKGWQEPAIFTREITVWK